MVSAYAIHMAYSFRSQLHEHIELGSTRLDQARQITIGLANMRTALRGITLFFLTKNPQGAAKAKSAFESSAADMERMLTNLASSKLSPEDRSEVRTSPFR